MAHALLPIGLNIGIDIPPVLYRVGPSLRGG